MSKALSIGSILNTPITNPNQIMLLAKEMELALKQKDQEVDQSALNNEILKLEVEKRIAHLIKSKVPRKRIREIIKNEFNINIK